MEVKDVSRYLTESDIKPSYQRIKIFEYLIENRNHPTVDMIYKALITQIPTLSKTTVYNTLDLFGEKGIVSVITIEDNEKRYDADISTHGHFKCESCGEIFDFEVEGVEKELSLPAGFKVNHTHVYVRGICSNCNALKN